jgi:nucleoside-diphosphate-sugar epimerase
MSITLSDTPVLVTGGTGYVAAWIIKGLLEEGAKVHITVRNAAKTEKYAHLTAMAEKYPGSLEVFEADLLKSGSFHAAMAGCKVVFHTASPFVVTQVKDPENKLVKPALEGTANVLQAVNDTPTVERVVLTSSVAAVFGDAIDLEKTERGVFSEKNWNESSSLTHQAYPYSKTVAERRAWEMADAQDRWQLVVLNPGFVLGPSLTPRVDSTSVAIMKQLGDGSLRFGAPEIYNAVVDVRDVAEAHIQAAVLPEVAGRHLLVSEVLSLVEMGKVLRKAFGKRYGFPTRALPRWLLMLAGPLLGFSREYFRRNLGLPLRFDNSKSIESLEMDYVPTAQTLTDHFQQLIEAKVV